MKMFIDTLKSLRLSQTLVVLFAGVLVLFSTACSRADTVADRVPGNPGPNTPGQSQPYKGGMNNFSDDASSRLSTESATKAKALKDKVQSRLNQKGVNSPDDLVDNVRTANPGKQAQRFGDDARRQANDVKDNLQTFGDRGAKNVKRNAGDAFDNAADAAKDTVDDSANATKRALDKAA
ncbi:MAG: hypothetical protein KME42_19350 [Tildeniella nuda ZEHNDER 1965/U140]|jgi:hypothetical protein|nr:hypothetical protein [Tildeniella nuda ZEHNDER 1965/U140]